MGEGPSGGERMEDEMIIKLFWTRDETAIKETKSKYGKYCHRIANNILHNKEDAEECENDTYLDAWNIMPPSRPFVLSAFLGAITRRIAIDRWRRREADKRKSSATVSLTELEDCIPSDKTIDDAIEASTLADLLSAFLRELPEAESDVFLRRYWYCDSIEAICYRYGYTASKTKMMLKRTRDKLKLKLEKEGIFL